MKETIMKETKENNISLDVKIKFPFQYMEKYFLGEMDYDTAYDSTMEECYRLIKEYVKNHSIKNT